MKERPILFSGAMVLALLDGSKTQTRRVVKPQPMPNTPGMMTFSEPFTRIYGKQIWFRGWGSVDRVTCPYGQPGDSLWVKETFWRDEEDNSIIYRADPDSDVVDVNKHETGSTKYNWKPSIFMPRRASRITLEITDVRVERLQDISESDAMAEGCNGMHDFDCSEGCSSNSSPHADQCCQCGNYSTREVYSRLWQSINGQGSWDLNPWVWVISFQKVPT